MATLTNAFGVDTVSIHEFECYGIEPEPRWPLEKGCIIHFPKTPICVVKHLGNLDVPCVAVTIDFPDGKRDDLLPLSTFTRWHKPIGCRRPVYPRGTAISLIRRCDNWAIACEKLAGRLVRVAEVREYTVEGPRDAARKGTVYDFDLVTVNGEILMD